MSFLSGYKTYIAIGLTIVWSGAYAAGYVPDGVYDLVQTGLVALGLWASRIGSLKKNDVIPSVVKDK